MSQHHSTYNTGVAPMAYGGIPTSYSSLSSWGTIATNAPHHKLSTPTTISFNVLNSPSTSQTGGSYLSSQTAYSPYAPSSVLTTASSSTAFTTAGPVQPRSQIRLIRCLQSPNPILVNFSHKRLDLSIYGSQMGCSAFDPSLSYAKVIVRFPNTNWKPIDVHNGGLALTVGDLMMQIHQYLHGSEPSTSDALTHRMQPSPAGGYRDASHQRDGYGYGVTQRITLLGAHHYFYGLTPAGEHNTWNLTLCTGS